MKLGRPVTWDPRLERFVNDAHADALLARKERSPYGIQRLLADNNWQPTTGEVVIKGNLWTYDSSYEANGKTVQVHNTNEFTDSKTEVFKIVTSDDGGAHWTPLIDGKAHKTGD